MAEQIKAARGTRDITPNEVYKWQYLESTARSVFEVFGFREIRTPIFEHTELFVKGTGEVTDIVQKEMYTFNDKGGRSLTLRPEGTPAVVRACLENNLFSETPIQKLYYIAPMFRYERPQAGRYRQHVQIGAEIFGIANPRADVELISMFLCFISKLNIDDTKLYLNSVGCKECRPIYVEALKNYAGERLDSLCETCKDRFQRNPFRMLDCKQQGCRSIFAKGPKTLDYLCDECREHFNTVTELLVRLGIAFEINPFLVRGLDYYTKTVFEVTARGLGAQDAIAGGGRYDNMVEDLGGKPTPGLGFGSGMDRLIVTMEAQKVKFPEPPTTQIYLASLGEKAATRIFEITYLLRKKGISAEMGMDRSLKSQMRIANKIGAKYVIIIGDNEIDRDMATLRNMANGQQESVNIHSVVDVIEEKLVY